MLLTPEFVRALERAWGEPAVAELEYPMAGREWELVARSAERGRVHDFTLLIPRGRELAVIRKPSYPPGVWRAPSGGMDAGERPEDAIAREAYEEAGLRITPARYLLRAHAVFRNGKETLGWTSHVFELRYLGGEPHPVDTREIAEARWASLEELGGPVHRALLATGLGGFAYRARLQELAAPLLGGVVAAGEGDTP